MNVLGILVGLLTAAGSSLLNVFLKKLEGVSPHFLTFVRMSAAVPALGFLVAIFPGWSMPQKEFWFIVLVVIMPLEIFLAWCITKAVQLSPVSIIGPLASFTSLFLVPVGFFVLGETPTISGLLGISAIIASSFFLGWKRRCGFHGSWKNLLAEKGIYFALAGAFIASITTSATKFSFQYAHPLLSAFYITAMVAAVLFPIAFLQQKQKVRLRMTALLGLWAVSGSSVALHNVGLSLMNVSYFISLKRLSMLLDVLFGKTLFKEEYTHERFIGAAFMVAGVVLIALG